MATAAVLAFPQPATPAADPEDDGNYLPIEKLHKQFMDYLGAKANEISEQKEARAYDAGSQWTQEEVNVLKKRKQPVVTFNLIAPKNNAVVGLVERLRQDPKCYPRTPKQQDGADLATAVLRFALDENNWKGKHTRIARFGAVDGVAGVEYDLEQGDHGDPDIRMHLVYPDTFFYDPRSYDEGFTDARFMGVSKWVDVEQAKEICKGHDEEIDDLVEGGGSGGTDLTSNPAREMAWVNTTLKRVRLTDHWYIRGGKWRWCLYINMVKMMEGISPFKDERGQTFPKYRMFSAAIDQDGDRFGFHRQWKSAQDEYNHRRSKALHLMNSRRVRATKGIVDDVEKARSEEARADGFIEMNPMPDGQYITDDQRAMADMRAHLDLMNGSREMIDNFGPNLALLGQGLQDSSGRAIALLQQAGMAQLGPYLSAFKNWKIRVYRDLWNIIQAHWKEERWIRVTDDEALAQFFQINQRTTNAYGQPIIVNNVGSLDVDFILDEGPDAINMQADNLSTLQALGPNFMQEYPDVAIELSNLSSAVKKTVLGKIKERQNAPPPPDPKVEAMKAQMAIDQQSGQQKLEFDAQHNAAQIQFMREKTAAEIQSGREKTAADIESKREAAALDRQLEMERMDLEDRKDQRKHFVTVHNANQDRAAAAQGGNKVSESISFKDLPPDGQQQMARQAGLDIALPDPPPEEPTKATAP